MSAPEPPADLATRNLPIVTVDAATPLHRFHTARFGPVFFDTTLSGRLNAPDGAYGVLYVAENPAGAFAESFLRTPGATLLAEDFIASKAYARLEWDRPLRLAQMFGPGLAKIGATAEATHGGLPYGVPQMWSKALHDHPDAVDGIAYRARHDDDEVCYAVFDHVTPVIEEERRTSLADDDDFLDLMIRYGIGLSD